MTMFKMRPEVVAETQKDQRIIDGKKLIVMIIDKVIHILIEYGFFVDDLENIRSSIEPTEIGNVIDLFFKDNGSLQETKCLQIMHVRDVEVSPNSPSIILDKIDKALMDDIKKGIIDIIDSNCSIGYKIETSIPGDELLFHFVDGTILIVMYFMYL